MTIRIRLVYKIKHLIEFLVGLWARFWYNQTICFLIKELTWRNSTLPGANEAQLHISQGLAVCVMTQSVPEAFWLPGATVSFLRNFFFISVEQSSYLLPQESKTWSNYTCSTFLRGKIHVGVYSNTWIWIR